MRVALTGDVALELIAPYFTEAGYEVYVPAGFGTWRQEVLDKESGLNRFRPDAIFNVTEFDETLGKEVEGFRDERMAKLASMPYSLKGIRAIVEEFGWKVAARPCKVLSVDADNTLWKGILSEDGKAALVEYRAFQEGLKELERKGVLLVLLTKNDPAESFMRADMALKDSDFAAKKIGWSPKPGNLAEACRELNLGTESVVFVDDNPHERAQMKAHLPEVEVVPFPEDMEKPAQFLRRLKTYFFSGAGRTREDFLRSARFEAMNEEGWKRDFANAGEYLESLGLYAKGAVAKEGDIPRLAQMAGKTNQFNATTIRRTEEDFAALLKDSGKRVWVFKAGDRFGDMGIVCYIVADLAKRRLTDFVMSCRAMGRTLENFAYAHVSGELGYAPGIDFTPTAKNAPFREFLESGRFNGKTHYRQGAV